MRTKIVATILLSTLLLAGCTASTEEDTTGEVTNGSQQETSPGDVGEQIAENQVVAPVNSAVNTGVESDVQATVADVTIWLANHVGAESIPTTGPDIVTPTQSDPDTTVYITGGFYDFTVEGFNTTTNYRYKYDSTTGQYSAG